MASEKESRAAASEAWLVDQATSACGFAILGEFFWSRLGGR